MMNKEERFELDLRAALAPEPASADLRRRVLEQAMPRNQPAPPASGWKALFDPRSWRIPTLVELGGAAAVASLAVGIFAGANGLVPSRAMLDTGGATTTTASADSGDNQIDLVALAYDSSSGIAGDLQ